MALAHMVHMTLGGGHIRGHEPPTCSQGDHTTHSVNSIFGITWEVPSTLEYLPPSFGFSSSTDQKHESKLISIPRDENALLLAHKRNISSSTAALVQSVTTSTFLFSSTQNIYIIDLGATEHIIDMSSNLSEYHPVASPLNVIPTHCSLAKATDLRETPHP